jgi:hypothetical protein
MDQLGALLRHAVNLLPQRQELKESLALALWEQAVGEALAKNTKPLRLYRSTLIVIVPSQAWRKELHLMRTEIVTKINENAGFRLIQDIEFRVDLNFAILPVALPEADSKSTTEPLDLPIESISDQGLRDRLIAAASSYLQRNS